MNFSMCIRTIFLGTVNERFSLSSKGRREWGWREEGVGEREKGGRGGEGKRWRERKCSGLYHYTILYYIILYYITYYIILLMNNDK